MRWKSISRKTVGCVVLMATIGVVVSGCDPMDEDELRDHPGQPFEVVFDPDTGVVPLPNTMALDEDGTFPEAGTCEAGESTAQGYFDDYLTGLSGWPAEAPITVTLSSAPKVDSIGDDDVQLWRSAGDGWERIEDVTVEYRDEDVDPCTGEVADAHIIEIIPGEGEIVTHQEYFAFISGDIEGETQPSLMPAEPMYLALQPIDLVDEEGNSAVDMLDDESAQALQMLRDTISPALEVIEEETDFSPEEMAGVWHWHTWDDTFVVFEPELGDIPFPNQAIIGDEGTVDLPLPGEEDPTRGLIEALNQRSGVSPNASGWISLIGGIDESTLDHETVLLAPQEELDTELMTEDEFELSYEEEWGRITYQPTDPLIFDQEYVAAVLTDVKGANGRSVQPTAPFVFLRNPHELIDEDGNSQVDVLDDETAQELEEGRDSFDLLFTLAPQLLGVERDDFATAWVYTPEDPTEALEDYRDLVLDELDEEDELYALRECEVEGADCDDDTHLVEVGDTMAHPNDPDVEVAMENVSHVYTGGEFFSIPIDIHQGQIGDGEERIGLSVYLPQEEQGEDVCEAPYDVAIVQHGLGHDRNHSGVAMANDLAAYPGCMATVAMDFPLHGGRVIGSENPHPESTPEGSGEGFLSADFVTSKSNFVQGVIDLTVLSQIIQAEIEVEFENDNGDNGDNGENDNGENDNGENDNGENDNGENDNGENDNGENDNGENDNGENDNGENDNGENDEETVVTVGGLDGLFADLEDVDGPLFTDQIGYVGVSLGGILGVPFAGIDPAVETVVLNGAGGRLSWLLAGDDEGPSELGQPILDMLADDVEGPGIEPGDQEFFEALTFVQWLADRIDPINFAATVGEETEVLLQMVEGDRVVVNRGTQVLARQMGVELEDTTFEGVAHSFIFNVDEGDEDFDAGQCARWQAAAWLESGLLGEGELPESLTVDECLD